MEGGQKLRIEEKGFEGSAPVSYKVFPNVRLGKNVIIEDYCIIGYPPRGTKPGELETVIGDNTIVRSHSVIYAGVTIGDHCQIGHSVFIREQTRIGNHSSVGMNVILEHHCLIGNNVRIQGQAGLCEYTIVEDNAWIGPRVITTNVLHPTCDRAKECLSGPIIRKGAILAANVTICPDLEIGENAFVGAGCVITKSVPADTVMFGNPARKVGSVWEMTCKYDMMKGESPYQPEKPVEEVKKIPLVDLAAQHQNLKQDLRLAIDRVVLNTRFIQGKEVREFETEFASFCGVAHAVGVGNGTDAIAIALRALGVGREDEVITTPHTFIATAEAILAVGAVPVFVDVDQTTYTLDPSKIAERITHRTKAIIPVHLYGNPAAMKEILAVAKKYHLKIVADAAQAHGSELDGKPISQWADATCFSFYPGKNLGAYGDAGAVVTDNAELASKIAMLRDHGRATKYEHLLVGVNSRLDSIQAGILSVKLFYLSKWNESRRKWAAYYRDGLQGLPMICPSERPEAKHVYHLFVIRAARRDALKEYMKERGIESGIHYPIPLHLQPALQGLGYGKGDFPVSESLAGDILSLPMFPELTQSQADQVLKTIRSFVQEG